MDFKLTEREELLRKSAREFAESEITPKIEAMEATGDFPVELLKPMAKQGITGLIAPREYDGLELGYLARTIVLEELGRVCAAIPMGMQVHHMAIAALKDFGTPEQKQRYIPPLARGETMGCVAITEPSGGSDILGMQSSATLKGDTWILNGRKCFITNSHTSDYWVVIVRTGEGSKGLTAFIVDKDAPGAKVGRVEHKVGLRGSNTGELVFDNCEVPAENVLGREGEGVRILMSGLDYERAVLAAGCIGIMQAAMDIVLPYVHERKQFGEAIGSFQLMQGKIADMYVSLSATRAYVYSVAKACDRGQTTRKDAAGAILYAAENGTKMALEAIQVLGGNGYINDYPTGRLLRDAKLYEIGAGTSEIRRWLIGRELFEETR